MTLTMLKKWAVCLAVLLLAALCPLGAHAAESQLTLSLTVPGYPAAVADGRAEVTLPDGTTVTASGETLPDGLLFVAEPLDGEVYDWVAACLAGKGTDIRAYDLYFLGSDGSRYELSGAVTVALSLGGAYARPAVYYVSPDGVPTQMDAAVNGEEIAFTTAHNSYYALLEQPEPAPRPAAERTPGDRRGHCQRHLGPAGAHPGKRAGGGRHIGHRRCQHARFVGRFAGGVRPGGCGAGCVAAETAVRGRF